MRSRILVAAAAAAAVAAATMGAPGLAWADPSPPPPIPNVLALAPASPLEFTVNDGLYAFSAPVGVNCVMSKASRTYGCSGTLPGAPAGANLVTGGPAGEPGFSVSDRPLYQFDQPVKELAEGTRLGMGTVSCGVIGGGVVCSNTFDQTGFVISSGGTFTFGAVNPLLDRPQGTNPFMN